MCLYMARSLPCCLAQEIHTGMLVHVLSHPHFAKQHIPKCRIWAFANEINNYISALKISKWLFAFSKRGKWGCTLSSSHTPKSLFNNNMVWNTNSRWDHRVLSQDWDALAAVLGCLPIASWCEKLLWALPADKFMKGSNLSPSPREAESVRGPFVVTLS